MTEEESLREWIEAWAKIDLPNNVSHPDSGWLFNTNREFRAQCPRLYNLLADTVVEQLLKEQEIEQ